ncbi:unnamed protein product [Laminaria digitata]
MQRSKHVLDRADYTAPTRKHELDHTDQESICRKISRSRSGNRSPVRSVKCCCCCYHINSSPQYYAVRGRSIKYSPLSTGVSDVELYCTRYVPIKCARGFINTRGWRGGNGPAVSRLLGRCPSRQGYPLLPHCLYLLPHLSLAQPTY